MGTFYYLASAYSHTDPNVRQSRYEDVQACVATLLNKRIWVYAPIVHTHDLAIKHGLPYDFEFWNEYNQTMISASGGLIFHRNDGWKQSRGCAAEVAFCKDIGKPLFFLDPEYNLLPAPEEG